MKSFFILATLWAIAVAKPEMYKENEEFNYSRSSSDAGTKSGYYDAQRGNMGGNYERAHNMDVVAQNQMSGLVRQVDGELGDGAKLRTGSVYTAANSKGIYGSGNYDLTNLAGRNFQEGTSFGNSHSSSYSNSQSQNSRYSGHQAAGYTSGNAYQSRDAHALDHSQTANLYDYGQQQSHSSGYRSQSGFHEQSAYDSSNVNSHAGAYGSGTQTSRLIGNGAPVRIIIRPGATVPIPVATQTYDASRRTSSGQNTLLTDAEILNSHGSASQPSNAKHYESSYSYRKQWEKHDTLPAVVPLPTATIPFPKNSELYEDNAHLSSSNLVASGATHASNAYSNVKSSNSQSRYRSDYEAQQQRASSASLVNRGTNFANSNADAYTQGQYAGVNTDLNSQVESLNSKPKSYQSSYSYHKSWERQGDPYVIKPASSGYDQASQRYVSTKNQGNTAHQTELDCDCDENGHVRVARSYDPKEFFGHQNLNQQSQNLEDFTQQAQSNFGQQSQNQWDRLEDLGQQTQNLEDFTQQAQSNLGQQTQNQWDRLEDLGQHTQSNFGQQTQNQWDKLEDLGQHRRNNMEHHIEEQSHQENFDRSSYNKTSDSHHIISRPSHGKNNDEQSVQPISSVWDKYDGFQQSQSSGNDFAMPLPHEQDNNRGYYSSHHSHHQESSYQQSHASESHSWYGNGHSSTQNDHSDELHKLAPVSSIWDKLDEIEQHSSLPKLNATENLQSKPLLNVEKDERPDRGDIGQEDSDEDEIETPEDAGRGDIGPVSNGNGQNAQVNRTQNNNQQVEHHHEHTDNIRSDLSVLSLDQQGAQDHINKLKANSEHNKTDAQENQNYLYQQAMEELDSIHDENHDAGFQAFLYEQSSQGHKKTGQQLLLEYFGPEDSLEQQNSQDFEQQTNLEQENLQGFGQNANLEQQDMHKYGHQLIQEQQNLQDFGHQTNYEQSNFPDFGQQQNLEEFVQHTNLEQENLQDFGQQTNLEQQNLQDFGQHSNLEQNNLHDFIQLKNLQHNQQDQKEFRQIAHSFEKQENIEQTFNQHSQYKSEQHSRSMDGGLHQESHPERLDSNTEVQKDKLQTKPVTETVVLPVEPVTEPPSFWKRVGNKFSSAKDSVVSWFKS